MTEADWLNSTDPQAKLEFLRATGRASARKLRLLACAYCRSIWHLLDVRSHRAVEVNEGYADGLASCEDLVRAGLGVISGRKGRRGVLRRAVACAVDPDGPVFTSAAWRSIWDREVPEQARLLRELGNPFRPVALEPTWLTPTVVSLAQAAYDERIMPSGPIAPARLRVLADALEEAGADPELVAHLRGPGPHVRGCWVVDLLTGRG